MLWPDTNKPDSASRVLLYAAAALIPTAVTALAKWMLDHSRQGRSVVLTQRVSTLAKSISELPVLPASASNPTVTPQSALTVELNATLHELNALQTRVRHNFTDMSSLASTMRSVFLLFRPKGPAAWTLHLLYYAYLPCFVFVAYAGWASRYIPDPGRPAGKPSDMASSLVFFLVVCGILGIPPLILRYFALKIHRKQCAQAQVALPAE